MRILDTSYLGKSFLRTILYSSVVLTGTHAFADDAWQLRPTMPAQQGFASDPTEASEPFKLRGTVSQTLMPKRSSALRLFTSDKEWRALDSRFELRPTTQSMQPYQAAEAVDPTGLRGVVETSVLNSYEMRAAVKSAEISNTGVWSALASFTPTVSASVSRSRSHDGVDDTISNSGSSSISVNMPIFTGGSRYFNLKAAKTRALSSHYSALATLDQVKIGAMQSYLQLATLEKAYQIYSKSYKDSGALLRATQARQKNGFASRGDVALVEANYAATGRNLKQTEGDLNRQRIELKSQIGRDIDHLSLRTNIEHHLPQDVEILLANAKRHNPSLLAANANYRAQKYATRASYGQFLPQVSVQGQYQKFFDEDYNGANAGKDSWSTSLQLSVPLVNLSSVTASVQQRQQTELAILREAEAFHGLQRDIRGLWADYQAMSQVVREAQRESKARKLAFKAARGQYREGFTSLENLISADSSQQSSALTVLQLGVQRDIMAAQLLSLAGMFDLSMLE